MGGTGEAMTEEKTPLSLTIVKADNGYILGHEDGQSVYEESHEDDLETFQKVLWEVIEHFGMLGSKHDEKRIRVTIEES